MQIIDFTKEHINQAIKITRQNYEVEREYAPVLPVVEQWPDLTYFAENKFGVAAIEEGELLGFLCSVSPFKNAFDSTDATGVFSPMHANGTVSENRAEIYARMYQAAAEKWAMAGATSHGICLYAHDKAGQAQFFNYGFGLRCVDAIRPMEAIDVIPCHGYTFEEIKQNEYLKVFPLEQMLDRHMAMSPTFMLRPSNDKTSFTEESIRNHSRYFVAKQQGKIAAYLKIERGGETFICNVSDYIHINGAFCLPEFRGTGVYPNLMNYVIGILKAEGYTRLGVDFESINPTAHRYWLKYFIRYTQGVVRRIDEHSIRN